METETRLKISQDLGKTAGSYYLMVAVFVWGDGKYHKGVAVTAAQH